MIFSLAWITWNWVEKWNWIYLSQNNISFSFISFLFFHKCFISFAFIFPLSRIKASLHDQTKEKANKRKAKVQIKHLFLREIKQIKAINLKTNDRNVIYISLYFLWNGRTHTFSDLLYQKSNQRPEWESCFEWIKFNLLRGWTESTRKTGKNCVKCI